MIRNVWLGVLTLAFAAAAAGCNRTDSARQNDMPVKAQQGVDKKGRPTKTMEAALEDPRVKKPR